MAEVEYHVLSVEEAAQTLGADHHLGLTPEEAARRLAANGPNKLGETPGRSLLAMLADQLKEVLVLILIAAALISGALGEWTDAVVILIIVVLNAALGVFQENKAEQAIKALQVMNKTTAKIIRAGKIIRSNQDDLVTGDLVLFEAGDAIPADARLVEIHSLQVDESMLTGESQPVPKILPPLADEDLPVGDRKNMVYMGTTVTAGRGTALIVATGMDTELGKIARLLQESPLEQTPLQRQLASLGKTLGLAAGAIVFLVFLAGLFRGENLFEMFFTAIALAVAAIPEGLPSVVTIVLAIGVTRMSRRNAVIRKLPAVETLGVADYICTDKNRHPD